MYLKIEIHRLDICSIDVPISFFTTWIYCSLRSSLLHRASYYKYSRATYISSSRGVVSFVKREKEEWKRKEKKRRKTKDRHLTKSIMIVKGRSRKNTIMSLAFSTPQGTLKPNWWIQRRGEKKGAKTMR